MTGRTKVFGLLAIVCFVVFGITGVGFVSSLSFRSNTTIGFTFNPTLSLSISGDLTINELTPGNYATSNTIDINVSSNASGGFYLTATAGTASDNNGNRLVNTSNSDYYFESLDSGVGLENMPDNTWGYRCEAIVHGAFSTDCSWESSFQGVPLDANDTGSTGIILLDATKAGWDGNPILFQIAAKAGSIQPAGTYTNVINFYAVTKPIIEPMTINDLEYMQEFKSLDSSDKESVLLSMVQNEQYILKDSRDEKEYYIAKLADGNVWMTQNLDHNIVTTPNFYTSQNTDIPANKSPLTMNTATYATTNTAWNSSTTTPRSYDPGDLCWNGNLNTNWDGTLANMTIPCTDSNANKHYSIGNYYNWTAAVAMNDSSSYTTNRQDVNQSICPAGWRLPSTTNATNGDPAKSYENLVDSLSLIARSQGNIQNSPVYFAYGGNWHLESWGVGHSGNYWSSVVDGNDNIYSYRLHFDVDGHLDPWGSDGRYEGYSVRCVAR